MDWRQRIEGWQGWQALRAWNGWRRYGPSAGSAVVHGVIGVAAVGLMAASVKPNTNPVSPPPPTRLEVTLVSETPPVARPPEPKAPPPQTSSADTFPEKPRIVLKKEEKAPAPAAADAGAVYVPPSPLIDVPAGLRSLMTTTPCTPVNGIKPKGCGTDWAGKISPEPGWQVASKEELKVFYRDFMPVCPYKVGCEPGEWISTNGTRSVFNSRGSPMMSGPGGTGPMIENRLPPNPQHRDPGFGD